MHNNDYLYYANILDTYSPDLNKSFKIASKYLDQHHSELIKSEDYWSFKLLLSNLARSAGGIEYVASELRKEQARRENRIWKKLIRKILKSA